MGAMGLHRVALLAALALAQGRGRSRRSLARGGTTAGPSTVEECVPTDENEGDDGSQGELCQVLDGDEVSWCIDTVKHPFLADQPGFFCDWCLCKACDVCTNLASPSPPPATAEVCVPTKENEGKDDGSGGELCQDWCTDEAGSPILVEQPGHFCDWCLCKACPVCDNLASPSPPPATVEECVPTKENEGEDDGSGGEQCQDFCTDPSNTGENSPGFFCDWCLCKACTVCDNLASPSPPPATAEACVPTAENKAKGDGSEEQCQDWCTDPSNTGENSPGLFCDWCVCKACTVCDNLASPSPPPPAAAADNKCAAIKWKKACKKTGCSWKGPKRAKKCIAKVCKDKSKNCDPSKVTNCAKSAKKLTVHKRGRQCLLSCIKYYPNLKLKKKDQCVMP